MNEDPEHGLLLIDCNLDNIHNIVNNLKKNIFYILVDDYDKDNIFNKIKNLDINITFYGLLFLNYDNIKLLLSDISYDILNNNNYSKYINFNFEYNLLEDIIIDYDTSFSFNKPSVSFLGGIFTINSILDSCINFQDGSGKIYGNIIGDYNINIIYTVSSISFIKNVRVICKPFIKYDISEFIIIYGDKLEISKPTISPNCDGIFYSSDTLIDKETGIIIDTFLPGINLININFKPTNFDLISNTQIKVTVNSLIAYEKTLIELNYDENYISLLPINNTKIENKKYFFSNHVNENITIDSETGSFSVNNCEVGIHNLVINYDKYSTNIVLIIKPYFSYSNIKDIIYGSTSYSELPIIKSNNNYTFSIDNNDIISIDPTSGLLCFPNSLSVGQYNIQINLHYQDTIINKTIYSFKVLPYLIYTPNTVDVNYNESHQTDIAIINPKGGKLSIENTDLFLIDNDNGKITIKNGLEIGKYNLKIVYNLNSVFVSYLFNVNINLVIDLSPLKTKLNYLVDNNLGTPIVSHIGGKFSLQNYNSGIKINNKTGEISIDKLNIGNYNIKINYNFNNKINTYNFNFDILPVISYNIKPIIFDNLIHESELPVVDPYNASSSFSLKDNDPRISINPTGKIIFNSLDVGNYTFTVIYNVNNIVSSFVYNLSILPYINYDIITSLPQVYPLGGRFNLVDNCLSINSNNGKIYNVEKLLAGKYKFDIHYEFNKINNIYTIHYENIPLVKYKCNNIILDFNQNYLSDLPEISETDGIFYSDTDLINIDKISGLINITNINVGIYKFNIFYEKNNSKTKIMFSLTVNPKLSYNDNLIIEYGQIYSSDLPNINPIGGFFIIQINNKKISINNKTGIININNLDIGSYVIPVTYSLNNTYIDYDYKIIIKPYFSYKNNELTMYINNKIKSDVPIIKPTGGIFELNYENILINQDGQIDFTNFNTIGKTSLIINYIFNNVRCTTEYKINLIPVIDINTEYTYYYGDDIKINISDELDIINNNNFKCISNSNQYFIVNNKTIDVGIHLITLQYNFNNTIISKDVNIIINPIFKYDSNLPFVNPKNGNFSIESDDINITSEGKLIYSNLKCGEYNFNISYEINNITTTIPYNITIDPYFYYDISYTELIYNTTDYSSLPTHNLSILNGKFSIENPINNVIINELSGLITFNKNISVGDYIFTINYLIDEQTISSKYNLKINPIFSYNTRDLSNKFNVIYSKYFETDPPIISGINDNYNFSIINNIDGINIDSRTGIINFNKDIILDVKSYNIVVSLNYKNSIINSNILVSILPDIYYESSLQNINYNNNFESAIPIVNPIKGIFKLLTDSNNIIIDNDGIIKSTNLDLGTYSFKVQYTYNNICNEVDYKIICHPVLFYDVNNVEIKYLESNTDSVISNLPITYPVGGTFKIIDCPLGIKINLEGQIICDDNLIVGNYNLIVVYQLNRNFTSTTFNIIMKPDVLYEDSIFEYLPIIYGTSPIISYIGGKFELIDNFKNITINKNTGILTLENIEPIQHNLLIKYTVNNVSIITFYNISIKPLLSYTYDSLINFGTPIKILSKVYPLGGKFKMDPQNNSYLDNEGNLICEDLDIGHYTFKIEYIFNNIFTQKVINFTIQTNIYYDKNIRLYSNKVNTIMPHNFNGYGLFSFVEDTKDNKINNYTGEITINNLPINSYSYKIKYSHNNIETLIDLDFDFIPIFYYDISNINLTYTKYGSSVKPYVSYYDNKCFFNFTTPFDFIEINKSSGIINFDNNLKIGDYELEINYNVNNIVETIKYNVIVYPLFLYTETSFTIIYNQKLNIKSPIKQPNNGKFYCQEFPDNLNLDGSISFNNLLDVGEYNFKVDYSFNNKTTTNNINIIVKPEMSYSINEIKQSYGTYYESELPSFKPNNGKFYLLDTYNGINIDSKTGKIIFDSSLDVNNYELVICYELNNIVVNCNYKYIIIPQINNTIIYNFEPSKIHIIKAPIVIPNGGNFKINTNINSIILEEDGSLTLSNLKVGKYNTLITYTLNNNKNNISYEINVKPIIKYNLETNKFFYKSGSISQQPQLVPSNGRLIGDNINDLGQIIFDQFNIGKHRIVIKYEVMLQITSFIFDFEIIPVFSYSKLIYEMNYNDIKYSVKPTIIPSNLKFNTNLNLDLNGVITFSNHDVGNHIFDIKYGSSIQTLKLIVKPIFNYIESDIIINYGEEKIIYPIIETKGGIFTSNDNDIVPNQSNGIIYLNNINVMNKIIIISYELNSVIANQTINIKCYPQFNYNISRTIINYGYPSHSTIPNINPIGGKFICDNLPNGCTIDENGIIYFNNPSIGNYEFEVIYNNILDSSITYNLIVNPICYYKKSEIFYYGLKNTSLEPVLNPSNGIFKLIDKTDSYTIDSNGIINISNNCKIGNYSIQVTYEINNIFILSTYNFEIQPFIFYENQKIFYGTIQTIKPTLLTHDGGTFTISMNNLYIDEYGEISNLNSLEPGIYYITVNYFFKKIYENKFKLVIKPNIDIQDNTIILSPENGEIIYDINLIKVINNQITSVNNKIGKYNLNIDYLYNNVKTTVNIDLIININKLYNSDIILYYNEYLEVDPLITSGIFETKSKFSNIKLNRNGKLIIDKPDVGSYKLIIEYINNNYILNTSVTIIIKPKIVYQDTEIIFGYYKLEPTIIYPINGTFIFDNKYSNIKYTNEGSIIFTKAYPLKYEFIVDYLCNGITDTCTFNIIVKPKLSLDLNLLSIKYNNEFTTNKITTLPVGGTFKSSLSYVSLSNSMLVVSKDNFIGNFNLQLEYTFNNFTSILNTTLLVEPEFYYENNQTILNYYDDVNSSKPYINPSGGQFTLDYNSNIGIVTINSYTGMLSFSKIEIGNYQLNIKYILNEFEIGTSYTIISKPVIYYSNMLNIKFTDSYTINSNIPTYYPKNGIFTINNNKCKIDDNGIITFTDLPVNTYDLTITYTINNNKLIAPYRLLVNPSISYNMSFINVMREHSYRSELPMVSPNGGTFRCDNLPNGVVLNQRNGMIVIFKMNETYKVSNLFKINTKIPDKGTYILAINYTVNQLTSTTKLFLNIV